MTNAWQEIVLRLSRSEERKNHGGKVQSVIPDLSLSVLWLLFSLMLLPGCGSSLLMDKEFVKTIPAPADAESHVIYCTDDFTPTVDGKLLEKRYVVIRLGANAARYPKVLTQEEDATRKVLNIEGRVIHPDGSHNR